MLDKKKAAKYVAIVETCGIIGNKKAMKGPQYQEWRGLDEFMHKVLLLTHPTGHVPFTSRLGCVTVERPSVLTTDCLAVRLLLQQQREGKRHDVPENQLQDGGRNRRQ